MDEYRLEIGRVVLSNSGRDMGRYYIICEILDEGYVMIADGKTHPLAKRKKKKIKHLTMFKEVLDGIAEKLKTGMKVYDKELGSALKTYNNKKLKESN